jgi:hypothetical protein
VLKGSNPKKEYWKDKINELARDRKNKSVRDLYRVQNEFIWNKKELPDQWKESIFVPVHKKGDKTDCNNYSGISLLSTSYKMLLNILLTMLSPYID